MMKLDFPGLAAACRLLRLDVGDLGEAALCKIDAGYEEKEAVRMTLVDYLCDRGLYHGNIRRLVDSGRVFSMSNDCDADKRRQPPPNNIANKAISRPVDANGLREHTKYRP